MDEPRTDSEVALATLDDKGSAPDARLRDAKSARAVYHSLRKADEGSAINRRRIQAMFDGEPPFSASALLRTHQVQRANINFGEANRWREVALSGYVGLLNGVDQLVKLRVTQGEIGERQRWEGIIAQEFTHMLRSWPAFDHTYLLLASNFVSFGVGIAYFEDEIDWRWKACGLSDFIIPRQTPASEECIEVAFSSKEYLVHELYAKIQDKEAAAAAGWNVPLVEEAIRKASARELNHDEYEKLQQELKNNDLFCSAKSATIKAIHCWTREFDGSFSHYIFCEDMLSGESNENEKGETGFLYANRSRFASVENAFSIFSWGIGSNGTYHSVRGLGHRIFAQIQETNKLGCQMLDGARLGASVSIQPKSARDADRLALQYYGPLAIIPSGVNVVEKAIPDLTKAVVPALNDLRQQMAQNMDFYSTDGVLSGPQNRDRTRYEVEAALEQSSRLSTTSMNLFYPAFSRLLREALRRATDPFYDEGDGGWREVLEFRERCFERGVPEEVLFSIDHSRTRAVRAVGNGSISSKVTSLRNMMELLPMLDEVGRKNVLHDRIAVEVGFDMVDRYAPEVEERPTSHDKIAELENIHLLEGKQIEVSPIDLPMAHLNKHLGVMLQTIQGINEGAIDPKEVIQGLMALFDHSNGHFDQISGDPTLGSFVSQVRETLQQAGEIIHNTNKDLEADRRQQAEDGVAPDGAQEGALSPQMQQRLAEHNLKLQMMQEKAQMEMNIRLMKAEQERSLADAKAAAKFSMIQ